MRVLLIYPKASEFTVADGSWTPLGLSFIAAVLRERGHIVSIFDRTVMQFKAQGRKESLDMSMLNHISSFKPDLIGFNTVTPLIYDTVNCIELIKGTSYSGKVAAGGHHATAMPGELLRRLDRLDYVIVGEGEVSLCELADGKPLKDISGLWYREFEREYEREYGTVSPQHCILRHNPPKQLEELDTLPFPAYDLLDMEFYTKRSFLNMRGRFIKSTSILGSRGCSFSCSFCSESLSYGKGVRFHSPQYIISLMKKLYTDYKIEGLYFHDNDFLVNEKRVYDICHMIMEEGLHEKLVWAIQGRADRINPPLLKTLKAAGCVLIEIGVEAAAQKQLDAINKRIKADTNENSIRLCKEAGISVHAYMMIGLPDETEEDLVTKLDWVKRVKPDTFSWSTLAIQPGTRMYNESQCSFFETGSWTKEAIDEYYSSHNLSAMTREQRRKWIEQNYAPFANKCARLNKLKVNKLSNLCKGVLAVCKRKLKLPNL